MKFFLKYCLYSFSVLICASCNAQSITESFDSAKTCYCRKDYNTVCALLKRISYFDPTFKSDSVNLLLARSYKQLQQYKTANSFYESLSDSAYAIEKAICLCLDHRFEEAKYKLSFCNDSQQNSQKYFIYGTIALQRDSIALATEYFLKMCQGNDSLSTEIRLFATNMQNLKHQKLLVYQIANACFPGMGFFMMKRPILGFQALAVTSFFAAAFVYTAVYFTLLDASIAVAPWLLRYYIGQIKRVKKNANEEMDNCKSVFYAKMLRFVQNT